MVHFAYALLGSRTTPWRAPAFATRAGNPLASDNRFPLPNRLR